MLANELLLSEAALAAISDTLKSLLRSQSICRENLLSSHHQQAFTSFPFRSPFSSKAVLFTYLSTQCCSAPTPNIPASHPSLLPAFPQQSSPLHHYLHTLQLTVTSLLFPAVLSKLTNEEIVRWPNYVTYKVPSPHSVTAVTPSSRDKRTSSPRLIPPTLQTLTGASFCSAGVGVCWWTSTRACSLLMRPFRGGAVVVAAAIQQKIPNFLWGTSVANGVRTNETDTKEIRL